MHATSHPTNYLHPAFARGGFYPSPLAGGGNRALGSLRLPTLSGLVAKYDHPYHHGGRWETVRRGAFSSLLRSKPHVEIQLMHLPEFVLPGTVSLSDNADGLLCQIYLADTLLARNLIAAMKWGFLTWLSPLWTDIEHELVVIDGVTVHGLRRINNMPELSFVDSPAQAVTRVGVNREHRHSEPMGLPSNPSERRRLQDFLSAVGAKDRSHHRYRVFPASSGQRQKTVQRASRRRPTLASVTTANRVPAQSQWKKVTVAGAMRR